MSKGQKRFELTKSRATNGGLIVAVFGAGLLAWAAYLESGVPALLANNFGAVFLSIGLITVIYEARMRSSFTAELLDMVELRQNLLDAGIRQVSEESDIVWKEILEGASSFTLVLIDAGAWIERDWSHVLSAGRHRRVMVEVFLPDPRGEDIPTLARHLGIDPADLSSTIERLKQLLEDGWKNAKSSEQPLVEASSLEVSYYPDLPSYSLFVADDEYVVVLHGVLERAAGEDAVALRFGRGTADFPSKWFRDQVQRLRNRKLVPVYSDIARVSD